MFGREMRLPIDPMREAPPLEESPDYPPVVKKQREIEWRKIWRPVYVTRRTSTKTIQSWWSGMVGGDGHSPVGAREVLSSLFRTLADRQGDIRCHLQNIV